MFIKATKKRVVITRPKDQVASWIARVTSAGATPVCISALEIAPVTDECHLQVTKNQILKLDEYDVLIFVSQNAVRFGFEWIEDFWPQLPERLNWIGIGAKTHDGIQSRLASFGISSQPFFSEQMTSEGLLATPLLNDVQQKKILIFRGLGGRTTLYDVLTERGALVDHCALYERVQPDDIGIRLSQEKLMPASDILTFFSGETLENFYKALQDIDFAQWQTFRIIVPSKRVYDLAKERGFVNVACAQNASEEAMWNALLPYLSET